MSDPAHETIINLGGAPGETPSFGIDGVQFIIPGPPGVKLAVSVVFFVLALYSFIWITEDAQKRGKSGCLAFFFLIAAGWPLSLLWWVWLRPPKPMQSQPPASPLPPQDS